jgi:hypothetical protein
VFANNQVQNLWWFLDKTRVSSTSSFRKHDSG